MLAFSSFLISLVNPEIKCNVDSVCIECVNSITDKQSPAAVTVTKEKPIPDSALSEILPMMDHQQFIWCKAVSQGVSQAATPAATPAARPVPKGVQRAPRPDGKSKSQREAEKRLQQDQRASRYLGHRVQLYMFEKNTAEGTLFQKNIFHSCIFMFPHPIKRLLRNNLSCGYGLTNKIQYYSKKIIFVPH
jgi:hypothetical protein